MTTDSQLLRQYAEQGDEAAFAEVVRRHTDLVYSAALRIARDTALAQDVTQTVFTKLAKVAGVLGGYPTPIGWLHTTTRHTAINAVRTEARRRTREHEAFTMQNISALPDANWEQLRPILDEAVSRLRERDRQAVLLRFFNGLSHQEVGTVLGLTENSAQKCVDRALEKLRTHFARRGVTVSAALLATAMNANSVQAAPVGLAANVAKTSTLGAGGGVSLVSALLLYFYMSTKIKTIVAVVIIAIFTSGGIWWFTQPTTAISEKTAAVSTPASTKVIASTPAQIPVIAQVTPPTAKPAPAPQPVAAPAQNATQAAQAELNVVIDDMATMMRSGDVMGMALKYMPPDKRPSAVPPGKEAQAMQEVMQQQQKQMQADPRMQAIYEAQAEAMESLKGQQPILNASGDEATYQMAMPAITLPNGSSEPARTEPAIFIKIDGKWYTEDRTGPP